MKKKLNLTNAFMLIAFLTSLGVFVYDLYMIGLSHYFTGELASYTPLGLASFVLSIFTMIGSMQYLENVLKEKNKR